MFEMSVIKRIKTIGITLVVILVFVDCQVNNQKLSVTHSIREYKLELCGECDFKNEPSWDGNGHMYVNKETDSCLLVLNNKNGDTLLTFLDRGIASWCYAETEKKMGNYFIEKKNLGKTIYSFDRDSTQLTVDVKGYFDNHLMSDYFLIDTINKSLKKLDFLPKPEVVNQIKKASQLNGNINVICFMDKYIFVSKDTLADSQVFYQIGVQYDIKNEGKSNGFIVYPKLLTKDNVQRLGIYKNRVTEYKDFIGCSYPSSDFDKICLYAKYFYQFTGKLENNEFQKLEKFQLVVVAENSKKERTIIEISKNEFPKLNSIEEKRANSGTVKGIRVDLFLYKGVHFVSTFLPKEDEFIDSFPPIYYLDTGKMEMIKVLPMEQESNKQKKDGSFKKSDLIILSDDRGRVSLFFDQFDIKKVGKDYRLIKREK